MKEILLFLIRLRVEPLTKMRAKLKAAKQKTEEKKETQVCFQGKLKSFEDLKVIKKRQKGKLLLNVLISRVFCSLRLFFLSKTKSKLLLFFFLGVTRQKRKTKTLNKIIHS